MRLFITRHGETIENKAGILQGHTEGTLSDLGIEQAEKLASRLKNENIDIIYSSDLGRAVSTARIIARYHPGIPLIFSRDLRERHFGEFQGKTTQQCGWNSRNRNNKYAEPANGEKQRMYTSGQRNSTITSWLNIQRIIYCSLPTGL